MLLARCALAFAAAALALGCGARAPRSEPAPRARTFSAGERDFLLDGRPFTVRAGALDAARVPAEYWSQRLASVRALGCNAVSTRIPWSRHEPRPGVFDFRGEQDLARFCRLAHEAGLAVVLRAGPYVGGEWDLGGLPAWLLANPKIALRSRDPAFLAPLERYVMRLGAELAPLQVTRGGPIVLVQIENEYGSFGTDTQYLGVLRETFVRAGFEVPFFTSDAPPNLARALHDDLLGAVNFAGDPAAPFAALRAAHPRGPVYCSEYYTGWFDTWGKTRRVPDGDAVLAGVAAMLARNQSFALHMVHGGTNFGSDAGANGPPFSPLTTSYDCGAPLDEAGRPTAAYHALRALFARQLPAGETLPEPPPPSPVIRVAPFQLAHAAPFLAQLGEARHTGALARMEELEQAHGALLYRATLPAGGPATLRVVDAHDLAYVYLDDKRLDVVDRRSGNNAIKLGERAAPAQLDVYVAAFGRVGYGAELHDRKGITERVVLADEKGTEELGPWSVYALPFDADFLERLAFEPCTQPLGRPAVYRGRFELEQAGDTFLDLRGWSQGQVWVNGHALGRYWQIGPQQTLYLPGCWLKRGTNEIHVLDLDGETTTLELHGAAEPVLTELGRDPLARKRMRRAGQTLDLAGLQPVVTETFADGQTEQRASFQPARGRYLALVAQSSQLGDDATTCAEIWLVGPGGVELPRSNWNVIYADSEELDAEDGSAVNVIDGDPRTAWHTQLGAPPSAHPHVIVIDLGEELAVTALRCLPRATSAAGRIRRCDVYLSKLPFPGL